MPFRVFIRDGHVDLVLLKGTQTTNLRSLVNVSGDPLHLAPSPLSVQAPQTRQIANAATHCNSFDVLVVARWSA